MPTTTNIAEGMVIEYNGEPHKIIEKEFGRQGRVSAFNRVKLQNIRSGKIISDTWQSGYKVEELTVDTKSMQFLYSDDKKGYFMDPETYEQFEVSLDMIPHGKSYLQPEAKYIFIIYEEKPISVELPKKITLEVKETAGSAKGNSAGNATKEAELETGVKLQVPLFINTGEKIVINTDSESYVSKAE